MESNNPLEKIKKLETQVFAVKADKNNYVSALFLQDGLKLLSKQVSTASDFEAAFEKGGLMVNKIFIPYDKITYFRYEMGGETLHLGLDGMKLKMTAATSLEFSGNAYLHNIALYLEKVQGYRREEKNASPLRAASGMLIFTLLALGFTWLEYNTATEGVRSYEQHRGGLKGLISDLLDELALTLGPTGSLALGLGLTAVCIYFAVKKYRNPPMETVLER